MAIIKKIENLTPEQGVSLRKTYEEWLAIGRSVEPINQDAARQVIHEFYSRLGKPAPIIMTFSSPMMCILAWGALKQLSGDKPQLRDQLWDQLWDQLGGQLRDQLRDQLGDQLWDQLGPQLGDQLWDQLWDQLGDQLRDQLGDQLWDQLWDQLGDQLGDQLWDQLWDQLGGQLRDQLGPQLGDQLGGQLWDQLGGQLRDQLGDQLGNYFAGNQWCAWEVFYRFCEEIGVKYTKEQSDLLNLWVRQSRSLHWWFPYEGIVLLSERHTSISVDDEGRLHSESGAACGYSDGWGVWAWHGVRVSQHVIESPDTITVEQIKSEENAEVRRVMVERMGWHRFVEISQTKTIHADTLHSRFPKLEWSAYVDNANPEALEYVDGEEKAELLESTLIRDFEHRSLKFVRLTCPSTGRIYIQRVAHDETRVYEAVGRSFGMSEEEYKSGKYLRQGDVLMWALDQSDNRIVQQHS